MWSVCVCLCVFWFEAHTFTWELQMLTETTCVGLETVQREEGKRRLCVAFFLSILEVN